MKTMKLIWTTKELEEIMGEPGPSDDLLIATIFTRPRDSSREVDISKVTGLIRNIVIWLPPGVRDLVWVSVLLAGRTLVGPVGGDDYYHSVPMDIPILKGTPVEVIVKNYDILHHHGVSVQVMVKEEESVQAI